MGHSGDEHENHDKGMQSRPVAQPLLKPLYFVLGILFIAIGSIGYVVPGLPGTIFFIIALWAFKRSSPRLEDWLLNKSFMGPTLRDWEADRSMKRETKVLAVSMLWCSIAFSCWLLWQRPSALWLVPTLLTVAICVSWFIWTRKTTAV